MRLFLIIIFMMNNNKNYFLCRQALARADVLLTMKHGMTRLDNVWGVGGGLRPVTSLVNSMGLLLRVIYLTIAWAIKNLFFLFFCKKKNQVF